MSNHIRQIFGLTAGVILIKGVEFATLSIVIRTLGAELYGILGSIKHFSSIIVLFLMGAMHASIVKYVAKSTSLGNFKESKAFSNTIFTFSSILVILNFVLSFSVFRDKILNDYFSGYLNNNLFVQTNLLVIFLSINSYLKSLLSALKIIRPITNNTVYMGALNAVGMLVMVHISGLSGVIQSIVIVTAVSCLNLYLALPKEFRPKIITRKSEFFFDSKFTWSYILPSFLSLAVINLVTAFLNSTVLSWEDGSKTFAVYASCITLATLSVVAQQSLGRVVFPVIVAIGDTSVSESYKKYLNFNLSVYIGLICGLPLVFIPELLQFIFGQEYTSIDAKLTLIYVGVFTILSAFREGIQRNLARDELLWMNLLSNTIWAISCFIYVYYYSHSNASSRAYAFVIGYGIQLITFLPIFNVRGLLSRKLSRMQLVVYILLLLAVIISSHWLLFISLKMRLAMLFGLIITILFSAVKVRNKIRLHNNPN